MKKIMWGLVAVVVLILATKQLTASGKTEAPVPKGVYRFYYYPTSNFYYDVANGNFVYTLDGGRNWEVKEAADPRTARAFNDRKVIDSRVPWVWKYNSDHRRKYGGLLTDYRQEGSTPAAPAAYNSREEKQRAGKVKKHKDRDWNAKEKDKEEKKREQRDREREKDKEEGRGLEDFTRDLKDKFKKLGKDN